jgi:tyrosine-protein kinase Etk/Wzc
MNAPPTSAIPDPRRRPATASDPPVVDVDADEVPRLSDYVDIFHDQRWLIGGVVAVALAVGAACATLATPVHRGNLLVQVEESEPDGKMFLSETSGLFEVKTPTTGEIQVLGSRLVLGAAVDQVGLRVEARPRYLPVIGEWLASRASGLSRPGVLGHGGRVAGTERIDVARFDVPAALENTEPFIVTALGDGRYAVRHRLLDAPLEGVVGQPLRRATPDGPVDIELGRLDGLPGAEFTVSVVSRYRAIEQLQGRLQLTEQGRQSNVIAVVLEDTDPVRLARSLAAIGDRYVLQNMERKSAEAQKTLAFLDAQLPVFERQLQVSEDAYAKFRNAHGNVDFDEETRVWLNRTSALQATLLDLQLRRREADLGFTSQSARMVMLDRQIATVQGELGSLNARIVGMPNIQRDALRLERDVKVNGDLYQSMRNNALQMRLVKEGRIGNVRLLDRAEVADAPVRPQKALIVAFALVLGLFAGPGLAIARARRTSGIRHADEVEAAVGLPVHAVLPHSPLQAALDGGRDGDGARLLADAHPRSAPIEALRNLRVTLRGGWRRAADNRILVTGATAGVGRSFVARNFALLLAQSGRRVLLVDADFRGADRDRAFGLAPSPGLSELLSGRAEAADALRVAVRPNLDVLTAGAAPDLPADLLESDVFVRTLDRLSPHYDVVVLDAAPILSAADAVAVALACGTVWIVARAEHGGLGELNEAIRRLHQAGVAVAGLLFNGVDLGRRFNRRYQHRHRGHRQVA